MADSNGTAKGDVRQGSDEEDAFADPPKAGEQAPAAPPKPAEEAFDEQTSAFTLATLTPKMREYVDVGDEAWDDVCSMPMTWAWKGVAGEHAHVEISGPSYSGKTTLAFLLAVASASTIGPVKVLGRAVAPVPPGKAVLVVEEENDRRSCGQKLRAACEMLGLDRKATLARVVTATRSGFTPGAEVTELMRADAARGVYGRVFLDSKARIFFKERANVEEDQAFTARWITDLINRGALSVWIVSHTRKGRAAEIEDLSGSGQRGACADTILLVTAKQGKNSSEVLSTKVVFKKIRENDENVVEKPKAIVFTIGRNAEKKWQISHKEAGVEDVHDEEGAQLRDRILKALRKGAMAISKMRVVLTVGVRKLDDAIYDLAKEKLVVKYKFERQGKTAWYARLREDADFDSFEELVPKGDGEDE